MSTTQRLGIDIVAADKTRAAFASANRSVGAFQKGLQNIAGLLSGGAVAIAIKNAVQSIVEINKHLEPVKTSFTLMGRAWQDFALNVGKGGLNEALIKFNTSIGQMLVGGKSLATVIGSLLGGVVRGMSAVFNALGRAISFAYDNAEIFGKILKGIAFGYATALLVGLGSAFVLFISSIRAAGLATAIFSLIQRRMLVLWIAIIAVGAKVTGTFEKLTSVVDAAIQGAEDLLPLLGDSVADGLNRMGFDVKSLTKDFADFDGKMKLLPKTFKEIDDATKKGAPALKVYNRGIADLQQFITGIRDEGAALGKTEGALTRLAQSQAFYNKMQDQGVKLTIAQKAAAEEWLNKIPDAVAGLEKQKSALQTAKDVGEAFKSTFSSAFASIVDGTSSVTSAIKSMVSSLLSSLVNLFANKAFAMLIEGGPGSGGTGGFIGKLFGGFFAGGGTLGAGKWGIAGENGPEPIVGPATVIPNRGSGVNVKVNVMNYGADPVDVRHNNSPGGPSIDVIIGRKIDGHISSGGADASMRGRFGATPQKARR